MKLPIYQIDAFAEVPFEGNPAAVCPLESWLPDALMQSIAGENNLSETAFFIPTATGFHIRWFTPTAEVDLCGHATLAAAYVLFHYQSYPKDCIEFQSKSGMLKVSRQQNQMVLDFPSQLPMDCAVPIEIQQAFNITPLKCLKSADYMVVFEHEDDVLTAEPDLELLKKLDGRGVIITAASVKYDFVTRFFAPKLGIHEDPVTGSAYTQLLPYWSKILGRNKLYARQLSSRGGNVTCELQDDRVLIAGSAVKYLQGEIEVSLTDKL
ncbi:MAG: PhzF family phenazine biosynthesis protein [Mariprofundaceae bacterium]